LPLQKNSTYTEILDPLRYRSKIANLSFISAIYTLSYRQITNFYRLLYMTPSEINANWTKLQERISIDFDTDLPDMKVMLFLIGVQELGKGPAKFSKRQKEELMHIANCRLFSELGFYELEGIDQDGWPHWKLVKPIPAYTLLEQEMVMRSLIITYFEINKY